MDSRNEHMRKFMQTVGDKTWRELVKESKSRDISVQELLRVEIIPNWIKSKDD